jgi:hypothetical protein
MKLTSCRSNLEQEKMDGPVEEQAAEAVQPSQKEKKKKVPKKKRCTKPDCASEGSQLCGKCLKAKYCSRECQVADWKAHKLVCCKD